MDGERASETDEWDRIETVWDRKNWTEQGQNHGNRGDAELLVNRASASFQRGCRHLGRIVEAR